MNFRSTIRNALPAALMLPAKSVFACAACYGASDAPMAKGMNWGIFTLLAVVGTVLCGIAGVGIFMVKRAAGVAAESPDAPISEETVKL